jgi:uncharacterized protein (DUF362 family)/Pyruvate/2-oxoacid:ferredoxin oxidoreductase delta subunit
MADPKVTVALARCPDYSAGAVSDAVAELLGLLGGMKGFVRPGARVLLKPNLLMPRAAAEAVTTHPAVVRAVGRAAMEAGGAVCIGDSPGAGTLSAVAEQAGIASVADELGVPLVEFTDPQPAERPAGARFQKLSVARAVHEADTVINLPKVKTHQQMVLTLAVKNLFGCVVGRQKVAWHMNAGRDSALFARVLVEVCQAVAPALSVADGVMGMEGTGPSHGDARRFGFLAASADPFALDAALAWLLGFAPSEVPVLGAAERARSDGLGVGVTGLDRIEWVGADPAEVRARDVKRPIMGRTTFLPDFLARVVRRFVTVRPRVKHAVCRQCGGCVEACPSRAMKIVDRRVKIDDTRCIRCFCCQELCPHGAIEARGSLFSRFLST